MLNNYSIKKKLTFVYIICIILPIIITNATFIGIAIANYQKEQMNIAENTSERLIYNINSVIDSTVSISNYLETDRNLDEFLQRNYLNASEYYEEFHKINALNLMGYYYTSQYVEDIQIYVDNETITNGKNYFKLSSIIEKEWYNKFLDNGEKMMLLVHYDTHNLYEQGYTKKVSLIKRLDNFYSSKNNVVLKIDIDYDLLKTYVENESFLGSIDIISNDEVILTSEKSSNSDNFQVVDANKNYMFTETFGVINNEWTISIVFDENDIFTILEQYNMLILLIILLNFIIPTVAIYFINKSLTERIGVLDSQMKLVQSEKYEEVSLDEGSDEIGNLIRTYNTMISRIKWLMEVVIRKNFEKKELDISKKQAELNALQSQINPHFLFNVLESIRMHSLIRGEQKTSEIIEKLASFMRRSLHWESDLISIKEEMKSVNEYLNIQKYRFSDRVDFYLHIIPECEQIKVPKFSIVTFVENACVHGIEKKAEGGIISVVVTKVSNELLIQITDTGLGIDEEKLNNIRKNIENANIDMLNTGKSIGILNSTIRLKLYYKNDVSVDIESVYGIGTEVLLTLPILSDEEILDGQN